MIIVKEAQLVKTRRGRTVVEMAASYDEGFGWITINGDQIIFSDDNDNILWFTASWRDLVKEVGVKSAVSIYKKFKDVWEQPSFIGSEDDIQALAALTDFVSSASKLSDSWRDLLNNNYPFIEDFELVLLDLTDWQNAIISIAEKK